MYTYTFCQDAVSRLRALREQNAHVAVIDTSLLGDISRVPEGIVIDTLPTSLVSTPLAITGFDSSQIYPDRHAGRDWYVLQTAYARWHYADQRATFTCQRMTTSDLLPTQVDWYHAQSYVTRARDAHEQACLVAYQAQQLMLPTIPGYILVDGQRQSYHDTFVIGYVSQPRTVLLSRSYGLERPVADYILACALLSPYQYLRCAQSSSQVACFVHTGREIARMDIAVDIAQDAPRLHELLSAVAYHIRAGNGYPIALSYAHELAVIPERIARSIDHMTGHTPSAKYYAKQLNLKIS